MELELESELGLTETVGWVATASVVVVVVVIEGHFSLVVEERKEAK